ncbi:MAG: hypothetical protein E7035_04695 [Verrucomicrobiaceae bacterium]|nr:hypothetical protein [Verrucomicrobiaceae bacterium]
MKVINFLLCLCFLFLFNVKLLGNTNNSKKEDDIEILNMVMLFDEHVEEQAKDLVEMSKNKVADVHMVSFFLVPEGNPPIDKLSLYEKKFKRLKKAIGNADCKVGIIFQATLGHGFALEVQNPYQKLVSRDDTTWEKNSTKNIACPLDKNFQKYILNCVERVAKLKPALLMVDDDFRLMGGRNACLCPLHLAKIKQDFGYDLTREQLKKHLAGNSELDRKISDAAWKTNEASLIELAKQFRKIIDKIDPYLHCEMCGSPKDMYYDGKIARILAGKGKPSTLRIGNARYNTPQTRDLFNTSRKLAIQKAIAKPDRIYAEIDTYPRNRYFTSARTLHSGLIVSMLEGASGAKYWPNRFVEYEPNSSVAYKKVLSENRMLYGELYNVLKGATHKGVADIIVPKYTTLRYEDSILLGNDYYWTHIIGVLGLPVNYCQLDKVNQPVFLRAKTAQMLSNEQLEKILSMGAVVDGGAVMEIQKRGLGKLLGVKGSVWKSDVKITRERLTERCGEYANKFIEPPVSSVKLEVYSSKTEVWSEYIHLPYTYGDKKLSRILAPACTYFENEKGGKIVVFASRPQGVNHLTESKKALYIKLLNRLSDMAIWYNGDAECYLKTLELADGKYLVSIVNVGLDPLEIFELGTTKSFSKVEYLSNDGKWKNADVKFENGKIIIKNRVETFYPFIMRFM